MSLVDAIAASLATNLGLSVSKGMDVRVPSTGTGNGFNALLAIGNEEAVAPEEQAAERESSPGHDENPHDKDQNVAYSLVSVVDVPPPAIDKPRAERPGPAEAPPAAEETDDASLPAAAAVDNDRSVSGPAAPRAKEAGAPAEEAAPVSQEDSMPGEEDLRKALAAQFGNIAGILEAFIRQLAGGNVVSAIANSAAATDIPSLVEGEGTIAAPAGEDAQARIALLKDILALVRQLQQALLHASASGQSGITIISQPLSLSSLPQDTQGHALDINHLVDQLNTKLAGLLAALAAQDGGDAGAGLAGDLPQFTDLKSQLKESISAIRAQLEPLSDANEKAYNHALSRFQALLGADKASQDNQQGDDLLRQALALIAKATGVAEQPKEAALTVKPSVAAPAAADKVQATPNPIVVNAVPVVPDSSANGNNAGYQQGGNNGQGALPLTAAAGASVGQAPAGDSTFARALALTGQRPIPEQVSIQIKTAIADGSSKITIQLDPEDLGKLDIKLNVRADGKTGVTITADNSNTLNLLQRDAQQLLRALHDAGLQTDGSSLSFNLRGDQQGQQGNSQMTGNYKKAQPDEDDDVLIQAVSRQYAINLNDGLDITI